MTAKATDSTGTTYTTKGGDKPSAPNLPVMTDYGPGTLNGNTVVLDKAIKKA